MNMHLHGHIKECIEDFGPVYSFWCFSFERLNGILGSYHTNNRTISVQIIKRFLEYEAPLVHVLPCASQAIQQGILTCSHVACYKPKVWSNCQHFFVSLKKLY